MNDGLDELLTKALARTEAPVDFTAKVMVRVNQRRSRLWRACTAAAATVALMIAGWSGFVHYRARQHERQLVFAIQLASEKIAAIDQRLKRSAAEIYMPENDLEKKVGR